MILKELIRQDSLAKLNIGKRPEVLNFLDDKLGSLKQFKDDKYQNLVFWGKSKKNLYIEQDFKNDYFYINYDKVWLVLELKYKLNYTDIQLLTSWYIKTTYNLKGVRTLKEITNRLAYIEITYNLKGVRTIKNNYYQILGN